MQRTRDRARYSHCCNTVSVMSTGTLCVAVEYAQRSVRRRAEQVSPRGDGVERVLLETLVLGSDPLHMRRVAAATPMMEQEVVLVVHHVQALDSGHFNVSKSSEQCERKISTCLLLAFVGSLSNHKRSHTLHSNPNSLLVNMFLQRVVLVFHPASNNSRTDNSSDDASMSTSAGGSLSEMSALLLGRAASSRLRLFLSRLSLFRSATVRGTFLEPPQSTLSLPEIRLVQIRRMPRHCQIFALIFAI
jgi:hypothetical protein